MVIPKFSKVNGINIIRPEIVTPRLVPILRSGELIGYRSKPPTTRSLNSSQGLNRSNTFQRDNLSDSIGRKIVPIQE